MATQHKRRSQTLVACVVAVLAAVVVALGVAAAGSGKRVAAGGQAAMGEALVSEGAGAGANEAASESDDSLSLFTTEPGATAELASLDATAQEAPAAFVMPDDVPYEPQVVLLSVAEGVSAGQVGAALAQVDEVATQDVSDAELADGTIKLEVAEGTSVEEAVNALLAAGVAQGAQPNYLYHAMRGDEDDLKELLDQTDVPADVDHVAPPAPESPDAPVSGEASQGDAQPQDAPAPQEPGGGAEGEAQPAEEPALPEDDISLAEDATADPQSLLEALAASANDPEASGQWALGSLKAYEAWGEAVCDGAVTIAVLDQCPDVSHEDLVGNVVGQYDAYASTQHIGSVAQHGTHVSGIAAAVTDNNLGVASVSHNAGLLAINVFSGVGSKDTADSRSIERAYRYLMDHAAELNVRVVNLSFGGEVSSSSSFSDDVLVKCINEAFEDYGIVTVAAAGNQSNGVVPYYEYPGDADNVVSVINLCQQGTGVVRDNSSNYNVEGQRAKNIAAPGKYIKSTVPTNRYATQSGTSMAAPQVAGVLALEFAANPSLGAQEAVDILYATATDLGDEGFDAQYGWGEANALAAVMAAKTGSYDAEKVEQAVVPEPKAFGATRIPVGATARYEVTDGTLSIKSGTAATLEGTTLTGVSVGTVTLALVDASGKERSTMSVAVYGTSGWWALASALDQSYALDLAGGSLYNGGNVQLYRANGTRAQAWRLERQSDGTFFVRSAKAGKMLDVAGGSKKSGANVQQYQANGSSAQRWRLSVDAANRVMLTNAGSGLALGVKGDVAANGRNVCQAGVTSSLGQKWVLTSTKADVGIIWDGVYRVSSRINRSYVLGVKKSSRANKANVQLVKASGASSQRWKFEYLGNGVYKVTNLNSGKALDVAGGKKKRGTNIQQYSWNGSSAQKWKLVSFSDGSFLLQRAETSWVVDVKGAKATNGRNVQQYTRNDGKGQRWYLSQY